MAYGSNHRQTKRLHCASAFNTAPNLKELPVENALSALGKRPTFPA
jgi:hypothetical protein